MHIYVEGAVTANGGDAAIMEAQMQQLSRALPRVQFTISDDLPAVARRRFPTINVVPRTYDTLVGAHRSARRLRNRLADLYVATAAGRLRPYAISAAAAYAQLRSNSSLAPLKAADLVYYTGGTSIVENYRLTPRIIGLLSAIALRKPLILGTQSLGPFTEPNIIASMQYIAEHAELLLVRDARSVRHLLDIGVSTDKIRCLPDIVFSLARDDEHAYDRRLRLHGPRVAISVREWRHFRSTDRHTGMRNYLQAIARLTQVLIGQYGAEVHFRSTCQGTPEYWADDSMIAQQVVELLSDPIAARVHMHRGYCPPHELRDFFSTCDFVIATRMHVAILAMCAGTPVMPIAYEFKTSELADSVGLAPWKLDIESINEGRVENKLRAFLDEPMAVATPMRSAVRQLARAARTTGDVVHEAVRRRLRMADRSITAV